MLDVRGFNLICSLTESGESGSSTTYCGYPRNVMYKDTDLRGVKVLAKENNNWQGSIVWIEGNQKQYFRSMIELLKLMDSALAKEEN